MKTYVMFVVTGDRKKKNYPRKPSLRVKWYHDVRIKVKVTLVQALRLCTGRMARRGGRVIAFHDHGTSSG